MIQQVYHRERCDRDITGGSTREITTQSISQREM